MAKITIQTDCGNVPKMAVLRDFTTAFATGTPTDILNNISEDIYWEMVGDKVINSKTEAEKMVKEMLDGSIEELNIQNIITQGDSGAVNGTMKFRGGQTFSFCDFYNFTGHGKKSKIKRIQSYVVEIKA